MDRMPDRVPLALSSTQRRLGVLLGVSVLLLVATLAGALFFAPGDTAGPAMAPHPDHPSMLRTVSGKSVGGSHAIQGWGYAVGLSILLLMTVCVLLGVAKQGRLGLLGLAMLIGCVGLALVFTALVVAYDAAPEGFLGGFPPATAWMIYGIWGFPALLLFGLSAVLRRVWLTEEDVELFRRTLAKRQGGSTTTSTTTSTIGGDGS